MGGLLCMISDTIDDTVLSDFSKDEIRVISAVELGQKNHLWVPIALIYHIASLPKGLTLISLKNVLRKKLVCNKKNEYNGYKLTSLGYDLLAIKTFANQIVAFSLKKQIGTGKEADVFELTNIDGKELVLKMHRLGSAPFRSVRSNREYVQTYVERSWLYFSRLAALREFSFARALNIYGFPVPFAISSNRHALLMSNLDGMQMAQIPKLMKPDFVYKQCMELLSRLASIGLVHCDFNEFNIIIDEMEIVSIIDFPQMISITHPNAKMLFERDVDCITRYFGRINFLSTYSGKTIYLKNEKYFKPNFDKIAGCLGSLDSHLPVAFS